MKKILFLFFLFPIFVWATDPAFNLVIFSNSSVPKFVLQWQNSSPYTILYTYDNDIDGWNFCTSSSATANLSHNTTIYTEGTGAIQVNYDDSASWEYGGMEHTYTSPGVDWSAYNGIHFYYKSDGQTANRNFYVYIDQDNDADGNRDDIWYYQMSISDANWHVYNLSWSDFSDVGTWDTDIVTNLAGTNIIRVYIVVQSSSGAQNGTFYVDSFGFFTPGPSGGYDGSKVVRTINTDPTGPSDGVVIFNGAGATCEDTSINLNVEYHYAVYNYTNNGSTTNFATTAPVVVGEMADYEDVSVIPSGLVDHNWGIYYYNPTDVNGKTGVADCVEEYNDFHAVIWANGSQSSGLGYYNDFVNIIDGLTHGTNSTLATGNVYENSATAKQDIKEWYDIGARAIMFSAYDGNSTTMNNLLDYCHYSNANYMKVFLLGVDPSTLTKIKPKDALLLTDLIVSNAVYSSLEKITNRLNWALYYKKTKDLDIYIYDSAEQNATLSQFNSHTNMYKFGYWWMLLYGIDNYGIGDNYYYGVNNHLLYHYNHPKVDIGTKYISDVIADGGGLFHRATDTGTVWMDYNNKRGWFSSYGAYYVSITGNDGNSGTNINQPFRHIKKAISVVSPGKKIYILPGTYDEANVIDTQTGTRLLPIMISAYSNGVWLTTASSSNILKFTNSVSYWKIRNIGFKNSSAEALKIINGSHNITIDGCIFSNISQTGVLLDAPYSTVKNSRFVQCNNGLEIDGTATEIQIQDSAFIKNTVYGLYIHSGDNHVLSGLSMLSNGSRGVYVSSGNNIILSHSQIIGNQGDGARFESNNNYFQNLTLYGNSGYALNLTGTGNTILNNISMDNSSGGVNSSSSVSVTYSTFCNETAVSGSASLGTGSVTGVNPLFANLPSDFRISMNSPCITNSNPVTVQGNRGRYSVNFSADLGPNVTEIDTIRFTTIKGIAGIPSKGSIEIIYPSGYQLSTDLVSKSFDGAVDLYVNGNILRITRTGDGTDTTAGHTEEVVIQGIKNIASTGTNTIQVNILDEYGEVIEQLRDSNLFKVLEPWKGPWYVHSDLGSDTTGLGTSGSPFQSIEKALSQLSTITINTCYIEGTFGTLEMDKTLGTSSHPIVLTKWTNDWTITNSTYGITFYNVDNVDYVYFKHLIIDNPSWYGIHVKKKISHIEFVSNTIQRSANNGGRGIWFDTGSDNSDNITFFGSKMMTLQYPVFTSVEVNGLNFQNSTISNSGTYAFYLSADLSGGSLKNCRIVNNNNGISLNTGKKLSNYVISNSQFISNANYPFLIQGDMTNCKIDGNYVAHHSQYGFYIGGTLSDVEFRSNIFIDNGTYSFYIANDANNVVIKKNYVKDSSGSALHFAKPIINLIFQSNILVNTGNYGFFAQASSTLADDFCNNVIVGNTSYAILFSQNFNSFTMRNNTIDMAGNYGVSLKSSGTINFRNNIITKQGTQTGTGLLLSSGNMTNAYNNIYNFSTLYSSTTAGAGALSTDPLYRDTNVNNWLGTNFYRLQEGSPCIDAGDPSDPVPSGGGSRIDMGAFDSSNTIVPPELYITNHYSVSGPIAGKYVPGNTITITLKYDNDAGGANTPSIEVIIPPNTIYVPQSASQSNHYHTGESGTIVEVYNGISWVSDTGVYDASQIKRIRWTFQQDIAGNDNSEGTDSSGACDGEFPDTDSGIVTYKVIIK